MQISYTFIKNHIFIFAQGFKTSKKMLQMKSNSLFTLFILNRFKRIVKKLIENQNS